MLKRTLLVIVSVLTLLVAAGAALLSGAQLATAINALLPDGWEVRTPEGLETNWQGVQLAQFSLHYQQCPLLTSQGFAVQWVAQNRITLQSATLDYSCFSKLPQTNSTDSAPFSLQGILALIPYGEVDIQALNWVNLPPDLSPRLKSLLDKPSQSHIHYAPESLTAQINQAVITLSAELRGQTLSTELHYQPENEQHQLHLTARITDDLSQIPQTLQADYQWHIPADWLGEALAEGKISLTGQQQAGQIQGNFAYQSQTNPKNLLNLPFQFADNSLTIERGQFGWDWLDDFPLNGFINAKLTPNTLDFKQLFPLKSDFRISLLSSGERGKGTIVIQNQEGEWLENSVKLPLRLTGEVKYQDFILYSAVPLDLQGSFDDLTLRFLPTSLLRVAGKQKYLTIQDLRFPLAGVRVDKTGITGRLQALFKGESPDFKQISLHLDGFANHFKAGQLSFFTDPADKKVQRDQWHWRFWGNSTLNSLKAKVEINGRGNWHEKLVQLSEFKGNLAQISQPSFVLEPMELSLSEPIKLAYEKYDLNGALALKSQKIRFRYGGELPNLQATLKMNGATDNLNLQGEVKASAVGPLRLFARRHLDAQASHILGKIYWNEQPLDVFQPLIPFRQNIVIKDGSVKGQTAFSYNAAQGFIAGGHFTVKNGSVSLPSGEINGANFSLPYQLKNGELDFGVKQPLALHIQHVDLGVPMSNVRVKINGHYPFSRQKPLHLSQLSLDLLGGQLSVDRFALPQTKIAYLRLQNIDLEQIFSTMQYSQLELKGRVNANFPFWLNGKPCYVCNGTLEQVSTSHLKFSPELQAAIEQGGYTEKILLALINGSDLNQLKANINVAENGKMDLAAKIKTELADQHRAKIQLNYNHQENLFDLWQMINYGSQFEQKIEHRLYQKLDER